MTVTIGIANAAPSASVQCSPDCSIDFVNAGFEFFDNNNPSVSILPTLIAESDLGPIGIRAVENQNGVTNFEQKT